MKSSNSWIREVLIAVAILVIPAISFKVSSQSGSTLYIINTTPHTVASFNLEKQSFTGLVGISKNPSTVFLGYCGKLLYVLHDGSPLVFYNEKTNTKARRPSSLSVIDAKSLSLLKKIPLGWRVSDMIFSSDSNHLLILGSGRPLPGKPKSNDGLNFLTMLNTLTGEIEFSVGKWISFKNIAVTPDFSRIAVVSVREFSLKPVQNRITVLNSKGEIVKETDLPTLSVSAVSTANSKMFFSNDQKWLYLLDLGLRSKKKKDTRLASIMIFNPENGELVKSYNIGNPPLCMIGSLSNDDFTLFTHKTAKEKSFQVFRINKEEIQALKTEIPESHYFAAVKDPPGIYAVGLEKLTFLPDNQDTSWQTLILNSFKDNVDAFDGRIINSFLLPASDRIILMSSQFNYTIINTLDNKLEGSGIIGRQAGRTITAVAGFYANMLLGALNYMAVYGSAFQPALAATSIDVFWNLAINNAAINNFRLWNVVITPDERFMYVFEPSSNDVTILNVTNGSVVDIVPAGAESKGISLTPDGRYLWILGRYRLRAVDTETNKVHIDYTIGEDVGLIKGITFIDAKNAAAVLYDKTLQIWDSEKGTITKTINRLSMAEFMVCTKIP